MEVRERGGQKGAIRRFFGPSSVVAFYRPDVAVCPACHSGEKGPDSEKKREGGQITGWHVIIGRSPPFLNLLLLYIERKESRKET